VKRGLAYHVGDGKKTQFWLDIWLDQVPLKILFPAIFRCCEQQEALVSEVLAEGSLNLTFRRSFGPAEMEEWRELNDRVAFRQLTNEEDVGYLTLNKDGNYTSKSLYMEILNHRVRDEKLVLLWKSKMPLKNKIFVWMCFRGRIQVKSELKNKGWPGEPGCKLCGELETADHLIFQCPLSNFTWRCLKEAMGWSQTPISFEDFNFF
jgi:hypothetical protein